MKSKLYIVHCIDTEGPLDESLEATFKRLEEIYGIKLVPSKENLRRIQNKEIDFDGKENEIANTFSKNLLNYNNTWEKIQSMHSIIMSKEYRDKYKDDAGNGLIYNWHCLDHVGFTENPRKRDLGFGKVFSFYLKQINKYGNIDKIYWHFHPVSKSQAAHIPCTSYDNSYPLIHQVISRRLIDFDWFPVVNRAGFHSVRQDSNFFLEQWIPIDYSNQSTIENTSDSNSEINRFGDWRRAPKEWYPYHPAHDDYQVPGSMNRVTTKCLNIGTRYKLLTDEEIESAFKYANENGTAILAYTNHDFRDMKLDIDDVQLRIRKISKKFNNVEIINSDAVNAIQKTIYKNQVRFEKVELKLEIKKIANVDCVFVECIKGEIFGTQPYLAIKDKQNNYYHDNFNEFNHVKSWFYYLDDLTINLDDIKTIAVASNDLYGNQSLKKINFFD